MGTLPRTFLLYVKGGLVVGRFTSYIEIACHEGATVSEDGWILMGGKRYGPQYLIDREGRKANHFKTDYDVLADWSKYHMKVPGTIYRCLYP